MKNQTRSNHFLLGSLATLSLAGVFYAAIQPVDGVSMTRGPTGDLIVKRGDALYYCTADGHRGTGMYGSGDLSEVSFIKTGTITRGDLVFKTAKIIHTPRPSLTEGRQLTYEFDDYGVVDVSIKTETGAVVRGYRNYMAYLADPVTSLAVGCRTFRRNYFGLAPR